MMGSTRFRLLLTVLLSAGCCFGQAGGSPAAIHAPGGNPRNLPQVPNAHHASEEGRVVFRTRSVLIQVPVVVTDKSGNHVHDLSKDKFQIFENGKEQQISIVEEI